jgi:large subunit ribosomal protein L25
MSATVTFDCQPRTACGKSANLSLRKEGRIPGVLYGGGGEATPLSLVSKELADHLRHHSRNTVISVVVDGTAHPAVIKDRDIHPVSRRLRHVDFLHLDEERPVTLYAPLVIEGEDPIGVRHGGILQVVRDRVKLSCLPSRIPEAITVDLSGLDADQSFTAADLQTDLDLLIPPDTVLYKILSPRVAAAHAVEGEAPAGEEAGGEEATAEAATEE